MNTQQAAVVHADLLDRMIDYQLWQRQEAAYLSAFSNSSFKSQLVKMHEETAQVLKDARVEIMQLREQLEEAIHRGNDWCDQAQKARAKIARLQAAITRKL